MTRSTKPCAITAVSASNSDGARSSARRRSSFALAPLGFMPHSHSRRESTSQQSNGIFINGMGNIRRLNSRKASKYSMSRCGNSFCAVSAARGSGDEHARLMRANFSCAALLLNLSVCHKAKFYVVSYRIARRAASAASHTPRSISGVTWRISASVMILP